VKGKRRTDVFRIGAIAERFGIHPQTLRMYEREGLLRPARTREPERPGARFFKPLRQTIESINDTFKGQLDLEQHGGRTRAGVIARVWQRILALTAAIELADRGLRRAVVTMCVGVGQGVAMAIEKLN